MISASWTFASGLRIVLKGGFPIRGSVDEKSELRVLPGNAGIGVRFQRESDASYSI
jgi:hypothetical protein